MVKFEGFLLCILLYATLEPGECHQDVSPAKTIVDALKKVMVLDVNTEDKDDSFHANTDLQPQVQTTSGLVKGSINNHSQAFYSIPYAHPPVGNLRFQSPQPLNTPSSTSDHSIKTEVYCTQPSNPSTHSQEDCLVLSIDVPKYVDLMNSDQPPLDRLPVLFFIHGGAFFIGSGTVPVYDGRFLSEITDTVVVTINYRLGPFGFLIFDDGKNTFDGNQGLKDQQLAMQWVQDNIENFGGDKNRVTIFGESAGAQSVMFHLVSQTSEPLFKSAIMESNPAFYLYPTRTEALEFTKRLVRILRCFTSNIKGCCVDHYSDYECLKEAPAENLITAMNKMSYEEIQNVHFQNAIEPFRPYIDEVEYKKQPMNLFMEGSWNKNKPLIIGTNKEELVILKLYPMLSMPFKFLFRFANHLMFGKDLGNKITDKYIEYYPDETNYVHLFGVEMTDIWFGCPSRALARLASETSQEFAYYYIFDHAPDRKGYDKVVQKFRGYSFHGTELIYVFRTIEHIGIIPVEGDIAVCNQFSHYWGSLAKSGHPYESSKIESKIEYPFWIPYVKIAGENAWASWNNLRFQSPEARLEQNYREDICDFWDSLKLYPSNTFAAGPTLTKTTAHIHDEH